MKFFDGAARRRRLGPRLCERIEAVHDHGEYILGPEVHELEGQLARAVGAKAVVTCASGTDALVLCLRAAGVGPGDVVFVPAFTFIATASAVVAAGARPVFVDISEDFSLDTASLEEKLFESSVSGARGEARAVLVVNLFGVPAPLEPLKNVAASHRLRLIEDGAQTFGAVRDGAVSPGRTGLGATSFFPTKPLGAFGDGGAVFLSSEAEADRVRALRSHGRVAKTGPALEPGTNSRLDTLQAAVLLTALEHFDDELALRAARAAFYRERLANLEPRGLTLPTASAAVTSSWAQFVVRVRLGGRPARDELRRRLAALGVPSAVHYETPLHLEPAFAGAGAVGSLPGAELAASEVLSLPFSADITEGEQEVVARALEQSLDALQASVGTNKSTCGTAPGVTS